MKPWLTVKEAALVVGRHERNIYRWIEAGRLTAHTDENGVLMVLGSDVTKVETLVKRGRPSTGRRPANRARKHDPIVYYLRFGNRIKIGTTTQSGKRLPAIPYDEWMAFEPGGRDLESRRHQEFAHALAAGHHEWFDATPDLLRHIETLRDANGDPLGFFEASTRRERELT